MLFKKMLVAVAIGTVAVSAFANDLARREAQQVMEMKDGSTIYVFDGGKMAMESPYGQATRMAPGMVMETRDGQKIAMVGDEVARLDNLLRADSLGTNSQ